MDIFHERPNAFRIIFLMLCVAMFLVALVSLYRFASSPTDENVFKNTPSDLYITKTFAATHIPPEKESKRFKQATIDNNVYIGDLLLSINDQMMSRPGDIRKSIASMSPEDTLELMIFRPLLSLDLTFQVQRKFFPDSALRDLPSTVFVTDITKGGASDRAGLKVGDIIYRINQQRFKDSGEAQVILQDGQTGNALAYDIIRNNQSLTVTITLAAVGIRLSILALTLCGLIYMLFATFIGLVRPNFKAARLLALAFITLGFFMVVIFPSISDRFFNYDAFTISREIILLICLFYTFPLSLHAQHYFPIERDELLKRKWIRYGGYILATVFATIVIITKDLEFMPLGMILLLLYNIIPFFFRKERSEEYKKLNKYIFYTAISVFAIFVIMFLGFIIVSNFNSDFFGIYNFFREFFSGYFGIVLALIPLAYAYTIGNFRLLDLDLRVRRNIQYHIVSVFWGLVLAVVLMKIIFMLPDMEIRLPNVKFEGSFIEILDMPLEDAERIFNEKLAVIFMSIALTFGLWKVRKTGQKWLDQKFDRAQFDYRRAASELAEVMAAQFTMDALAEGIVQKLSEIMQVKQCGIMFFRNENKCCCQRIYGMPEYKWKTFCKNIEDKIVDLLQKNETDFRFSIESYNDETEAFFEKNGFKHLTAIRSKDKLLGVIFVGEKRSESPFHKDDLMFLATISKQASVAIENAFLYEGLAEQERLRHELNIARRIQLASLPQKTPFIKGLDISGTSIPALEVGGDYYDYLNSRSSDFTVIIGDVSGKGTSAALYMSKAQGIMRSLNEFGVTPKELLIRANRLLINDMEKSSFITVLGGAFDPKQKKLRIARAGHNPLYHFCAKNQKVFEYIPKGMGLGLTRTKHFEETLEEMEIDYNNGDIFLFITDGITEAKDDNHNEYGEEPLFDILKNSNGDPAEAIRDSIVNSVNTFAGSMPQHDDLTIVVIKVMK